MGTLIVRLLCAWLAFGSLLVVAQGAVYSTTESSVRFSQCLIREVSRSPHFDLKDQSSLADVANDMIRAMGDSSRGVKGPFTRKVLATAFVSSVADIVILEDSERNYFRKDIYQTALDQCSVAAVGYIDSPFVDEAVRIMATLEMDKSSVYGNPKAVGGSTHNSSHLAPERRPGGIDRAAYAPSPVQRAYARQYSPNSETTDHSDDFASGRAPVGSPDYPSASSTRMHPSGTAYDRAGQIGEYSEASRRGVGKSAVYPDSVSSLSKEEREEALSPHPLPESKGTDIPHFKESRTVVKLPGTEPESPGQTPFRDIRMPKTDERPTQAAHVPSTTEDFHDVTLPSTVPATDAEGADLPPPDSVSLESILSDIFIGSPSFLNAFGSETDENQALNKALLITRQSLSGYDSDVAAEALNAVAAAVSAVKVISPQSYASAISAALARVLRLHGMPLFAEGSSFAGSVLSNLDSSDESVEQPPGDERDSAADDSRHSRQKAVPRVDFESPALVPEDIQGEIFSEALSQYLRGSSRVTDLFCGNNSSDVTTYFILVKSAMSEYGMQVSSIAGSAISGALADLTPDALCSKFPRIISDAVAEILYENELLEEADPEELSKRFDFSANVAPTVQSQYGQKTTLVNVSRPTEDSDKHAPNFQPSFEDNSTEPSLRALNETPAVFLHSNTTDTQKKDYPDIQQQDNTQAAKRDFSNGESNTKYPPAEHQTVPMAPTGFTPISDEELTTTITYLEALTNDPATTTTESTSTEYPPVNQKELATLLLDEMESVLDALNDRPSDEKQYTTESGITLEDITLTPTIVPPETATETPKASTVDATSIRKHHHRGRKRRRRKSTTPQPVTRSMSVDADGSESASSSSNGSSYQKRSSSEVRSSNQPVVLYPSFQGPVSPDPPSPESRRSSESSDSTQSDDTSLVLARAVSQIASSTVTYIRTTPNYNVMEVCARVNELAVIVGIPPVDRCTEAPLIDYLLNVLKSVTKILKGV